MTKMKSRTKTKKKTTIGTEPKKYLYGVRFKKEFRCFGKGQKFEFSSGVTLLVGDQGTGKSTLLALIKNSVTDDYRGKDAKALIEIAAVPAPLFFFDFEKDNPRVQSYLTDRNPMFQIASKFKSHGETVLPILEFVSDGEGKVFLIDEPDVGLAPRSVLRLIQLFEKAVANGSQIVASVHHPWVMEAFGTVLSLEHRKMMAASDFLESQRAPHERT